MSMCITTQTGSSLPDTSLLPSPLPIAASAILRLLYLLLYSEHVNYIQVLVSFSFPIPPVSSLPLVCD
jgi:hypothetical protein